MSRSLLVLISLAAACAQTRFPWESDNQDLKGPVRNVRIERAEIRREQGELREGAPRSVEEAQYRPDGRLAMRFFFNAAGVLEKREVAHFDPTGRRIALVTYDARGIEVYGRYFRPSPSNAEEEIDREGNAPMDRIVRKFDSERRVASVEDYDLSGQMQYRLVPAWDKQGRLAAVLMFVTGLKEFDPTAPEANPVSLMMRVDIEYSPDKKAQLTVTGPGGEVLSKSSVEERFAPAAVDNVLFHHQNPTGGGIIDQVEETDAHGNWTKSRQIRATDKEPVSVTYRRITYFE